MYSFSYLEPVCCSMSSFNCCFLTCIQISQEASEVTVLRHYQKTKERVVPQLLEWSSHSLAYEVTQLIQNQPHHIPWPLHSPSVMAHTLGVCFPLNLPFTYCCVSQWIFFFAVRHQELELHWSWNQATWVLTRLKSQLDITEWLNIAQSPCHVRLSPNLR